MSKQDDGGPAFPVHGGFEGDDYRNRILGGGMSLRDHFAGLAMQGYLASMRPTDNPADSLGVISECAYMVADAMLTARRT